MSNFEFTRPTWLDQKNPFEDQRELNVELTAFAREHWQVTQSLRLFALALAETSPDKDALVAAFQAHLDEYERKTGHILPPLFPDD